MLTGASLFVRSKQSSSERDLLTKAAWFVGAYVASGLLGTYPYLLAGIYLATWLGRMVRANTALVVYSLLLALGGVGYEGSLSSTGAFAYAEPQFFHVPVWLGGIYLHGAPLGIAIATVLRKRRASL